MMGSFYQLRDDVTVAGRWHIGEIREKNGSEPSLDTGTAFHGSETLLAEVTRVGRILDFSLTSFAVPVATRRLAQEVQAVAGLDLQCIPVDTADQADMVVMNSVRVVRCLDEKHSEFSKWTRQDHRADLAGQYRQVTKLIVDPYAIPVDAHFFRIESWLVALIVSENVKVAMERVGCLGAKFIEVTPHVG